MTVFFACSNHAHAECQGMLATGAICTCACHSAGLDTEGAAKMACELGSLADIPAGERCGGVAEGWRDTVCSRMRLHLGGCHAHGEDGVTCLLVWTGAMGSKAVGGQTPVGAGSCGDPGGLDHDCVEPAAGTGQGQNEIGPKPTVAGNGKQDHKKVVFGKCVECGTPILRTQKRKHQGKSWYHADCLSPEASEQPSRGPGVIIDGDAEDLRQGRTGLAMRGRLPTLLELLENKLNYAGPRDKTVTIKISINTARMILDAERPPAGFRFRKP